MEVRFAKADVDVAAAGTNPNADAIFPPTGVQPVQYVEIQTANKKEEEFYLEFTCKRSDGLKATIQREAQQFFAFTPRISRSPPPLSFFPCVVRRYMTSPRIVPAPEESM